MPRNYHITKNIQTEYYFHVTLQLQLKNSEIKIEKTGKSKRKCIRKLITKNKKKIHKTITRSRYSSFSLIFFLYICRHTMYLMINSSKKGKFSIHKAAVRSNFLMENSKHIYNKIYILKILCVSRFVENSSTFFIFLLWDIYL